MAEQGKGERPEKAADRSYEEMASRLLRQAKKLHDSDHGDGGGADFLVSSANVWALLELASALRQTKG